MDVFKLAIAAGVTKMQLKSAKSDNRPKDALIALLKSATVSDLSAGVEQPGGGTVPAGNEETAAEHINNNAKDTAMNTQQVEHNDTIFLSEWPYPTEYGDHYETPKCAFKDIKPILRQIAKDANGIDFCVASHLQHATSPFTTTQSNF